MRTAPQPQGGSKRAPSVSVVIPCYGYGRFLTEAVGSVLDEQEGVEARVLVIDDASRDDSADIARAIARHHSRVEVVVHQKNRGHIATYNEGLLEWADGDYCVLMSADDMLAPGSLRRAVDLLDAHPSVGFVYGHALSFQDGGPLPVARTSVRGWRVLPGQQWLQRRFRLARTGIISPEVVVRTSLQKRMGGYDARLPHHGDTEMWLRLAAHADVGYIRGADQAYRRWHGKNMSTDYDLSGSTSSPLMDLDQRRLAFESVLQRGTAQLAEAERLADVVHRKLAWEALFAAGRAYDEGRLDSTQVAALIEFALDCYPGAENMFAFRALRLRQRIGARAAGRLQPIMPPERTRRFISESRYRYGSLSEAIDSFVASADCRQLVDVWRTATPRSSTMPARAGR